MLPHVGFRFVKRKKSLWFFVTVKRKDEKLLGSFFDERVRTYVCIELLHEEKLENGEDAIARRNCTGKSANRQDEHFFFRFFIFFPLFFFLPWWLSWRTDRTCRQRPIPFA